MSWPPRIGEVLPRAQDAYNVIEKLGEYSLDATHAAGRHKATVFHRVLGITVADADYLVEVLLSEVRVRPITQVRVNQPWGFTCTVLVRVQGLGEQSKRTADVLTSWEIRNQGDAPRLVTAYVA